MSKIRAVIDALFPPPPLPVKPDVSADMAKRRMRIDARMLATLIAQTRSKPAEEIVAYEPPKGVIPETTMAMDYAPNLAYLNGIFGGMGFMGYPALSQLTQQPEYRKISGVIAEEMTRKWIDVINTGETDKTERIGKILAALSRLKVRDMFRQAAESDGFFGRGQIYIDLKMAGKTLARDDPAELQTPLTITKDKIPVGSLVALKIVEPVWTYPADYDTQNPLRPDYYRPSAWYIMSKKVHASRLLTFISRDVPDMLKPVYNFGGLSMSQLAKPYVDNWLRTRDSVGEILHSFSTSGVSTDMSAALAGGEGSDVLQRAELFCAMRDNKNMLLLDKDTEEFFQFTVPLTGLDALQAQAQEQMASVSSIPLVKLLGITPAGLNASADPEIRAFYDYLSGLQENIFRDPLKTVLDIVQLSEFGEIDEDITFRFVPLWQSSDLELAGIRKTNADTDAVLVTAGIILNDEARTRLAGDENSGYDNLDLNADLGNETQVDDE